MTKQEKTLIKLIEQQISEYDLHVDNARKVSLDYDSLKPDEQVQYDTTQKALVEQRDNRDSNERFAADYESMSMQEQLIFLQSVLDFKQRK